MGRLIAPIGGNTPEANPNSAVRRWWPLAVGVV